MVLILFLISQVVYLIIQATILSLNAPKMEILLHAKIVEAYNSMKQIDRLGAFEEDDEAGTTFALLKQTIEALKETFEDGQEEEGDGDGRGVHEGMPSTESGPGPVGDRADDRVGEPVHHEGE